MLITVHEFGHFIASRLTGIAVKEFSIGFGPKIVQWKSKKHETLFTLRPIPMGGYCMYYGDETDQENVDDPRAFDKAAVWKRMLSVFCGPLMNFVLAFVVAVVLMAGYGFTVAQPFVESVEANRGEKVRRPAKIAFTAADETGKEALLDLLADFPADDDVLAFALSQFQKQPDKRALYAGYLGKLGDDRALEPLLEAAENPQVAYIDYIEIRNAIERLGGEAPIRAFDDDPTYRAVKRLQSR